MTEDSYTYLPNDERILCFDEYNTVSEGLFEPGKQNKYTYCLNNPIKHIDDNGHEVITATTIIVCAVIALAPVAYVMYLDYATRPEQRRAQALTKIYDKYYEKLSFSERYQLECLMNENGQILLTKLIKGSLVLDATLMLSSDYKELFVNILPQKANYDLWKQVALALGATAVSKEDYEKFMKEYAKAIKNFEEDVE